MHESIAVRGGVVADADTLLEIQRAAAVVAYAHVFPQDRHPFPVADVLERWRTTLADAEARVLVAEADGVPVGFAALRPRWLDALYVGPTRWGVGVGSLLHDRSLALLRQLDGGRCYLWVLEKNRRARRFYERRGWRLDGERRVIRFPPNPVDVRYTLDF